MEDMDHEAQGEVIRDLVIRKVILGATMFNNLEAEGFRVGTHNNNLISNRVCLVG